MRLPVHFIMAADVEQDNLIFGQQQGQGYAVGIGQSDGMASGKLAGERMKAEARLKGVLLQGADRCRKARFKIRVFPEKLACLAEKDFRGGNTEHAQSPS